VCGLVVLCSVGYMVMCCIINCGYNFCLFGIIVVGWWKVVGLFWCGGGYWYIVDCNVICLDCILGCLGDYICDCGCWSCNCWCGYLFWLFEFVY